MPLETANCTIRNLVAMSLSRTVAALSVQTLPMADNPPFYSDPRIMTSKDQSSHLGHIDLAGPTTSLLMADDADHLT